MKKFAIGVLFVLSTFLCCTTIVSAGVFTGGFSSASNLRYVCTESISTYECSYHVQTMADLWSAESSNVALVYDSTARNPRNGCFTQPVELSYGTSSDPSLLGMITPYKSFTCFSGSLASTTDQWVKVFVTIYTVNIDALSNVYGFDSILCIKKTTLHEFGHVLSIAHPTNSTTAVMTQGLSELITLQSYDVSSLIQKWGS
jgi:hypothetical protein